jgi:hypothetical protein
MTGYLDVNNVQVPEPEPADKTLTVEESTPYNIKEQEKMTRGLRNNP